MKLTPSEVPLTEPQVKKGLNLIVQDGLMAEAMATLTGGAFLVSYALKLGASNFQIGLLASMPTLTNLFQLLAIYLIYLIGNRRVLSVTTSLFARLPLLMISLIPFLFSPSTGLSLLIVFLSFHYILGAISGCSWNSWMKDLVPENQLGTYFSNRSRLIQMLNVVLSLACAFFLDFIKSRFPQWEMNTYSIMFFLGGLAGLFGVYVVSKVPEPKLAAIKSNVFSLFKTPFKEKNFRNLLIFNSFWAFAVNLAAPFFSVYLLKMLNLPLSYVIGFTILSQATNILFIRVWGKYSDKYSNKTILRICGPVYLCCILAFTFTTMPHAHSLTLPLLVLIYMFNGISIAGINLSLTNIGMKLAPKEGEATAFLTIRGLTNALFAGIAPIIGGYFVDFFSKRELSFNFEWKAPDGNFILHTLNIQTWDFFFVFAFILGIVALYRLSYVKEKGDVHQKVVINEISSSFRKELKSNAMFQGIRSMFYIPFSFFTILKRKRKIYKYKVKKKANRAAVKLVSISESSKKNQSKGRKLIKA